MLTRRRSGGSHVLRVAVLCSRRAPGLSYLLEAPERGRSYEVVAVITSDAECVERERLAAARVPCVLHHLRAFYEARGARLGDMGPRADYDRGTVELLAPYRPDLVILCGYLHIVTRPILEAYAERVINVHDSDLMLTDATGLPKYRGLHAVRDAVFAGEGETRSTVHLATPVCDAGPPMIRSWSFPTHPMVDEARSSGAADILKAYAYAQREWMMRASWGPLLATAIGLYAEDQVRILHGRALVAGAVGPGDLSPPGAVLTGGTGMSHAVALARGR
jgi:phosphoribosylglycinamide formyltransferase-1